MLCQLNLILNYNQGLALFKQNRSLGLVDKKMYKIRTMKISLFNNLMLGYIPPITTSRSPRL